MNNFNISITGDLGSGKSSVAKVLCKLLDYQYFSTGSVQREMAKDKGMDTLELNYYSEKDTKIDDYIDDYLRRINTGDVSYILDSRLAWFFVTKSFKIYLTVQPEIAAKRVLSDAERSSEPFAADIKTKSDALLERRSVENRRFQRIYGVDCADLNNYDLIVDTSERSIQETVDLIIDNFEQWKNKLPFAKVWAEAR